jgi:ESS family glutamate:Na+ symporter
MTAVTKVHGAPTAFIILPSVSAFFIDIANAVVIGLFRQVIASLNTG